MGVKSCPRCQAVQDEAVAACDCGYEFPAQPLSLLGRIRRRLATRFCPACPQCGSRDCTRVGEFTEVDVLPPPPLWLTLTRGSLFRRHTQYTYLCHACGHLWTV